ncbi:MAG: hypothetical protein ACP5N2_00765 [Candidatus Nanoarchaeia archaeon]
MKCSKCKTSALQNVEYAGNYYCEKHFLELIEKRIRRNLRTRKLLDVKEKYKFIDDSSSESRISEYFLSKIFQGRLLFKKYKKNSFSDNVIVATNLDEQVLLFLNTFLKNEKKENEKTIKPLEVVTQREIEFLCSILNIKFEPRIKRDLLSDLEKKYPGTKFSLFQSKLNIENK